MCSLTCGTRLVLPGGTTYNFFFQFHLSNCAIIKGYLLNSEQWFVSNVVYISNNSLYQMLYTPQCITRNNEATSKSVTTHSLILVHTHARKVPQTPLYYKTLFLFMYVCPYLQHITLMIQRSHWDRSKI